MVVEDVEFGEMFLYHSCIEMWPHPTLKVMYTVCILMIQAVIPSTVVVCIHARIARYLHAHATVQRDSRRAQRELSRNKRTTILLSETFSQNLCRNSTCQEYRGM
ncbi:hypothetical protein GE061_012703 [Apolygus lucorum]|uniref:G-protein coupled receptors family 1 profile domain-containing protein n=1 Tax=Apolygus lucorum TaxID=248454 RepID=A0A8S9XT18_APOLU|nr:hypothetical protein GE061_012703 [Apolygus lucorum]